MPGWGLSTESLAPEVSPQERAWGEGRIGDCLGGLETTVSSLMGQGLPGRLENKAVAEEGSNILGAEKWKATSGGTWEKSQVCDSAGEGREEGVGPHRILPTHSKHTSQIPIRKLCFPVHPLPPPPPRTMHSPDLGLPAIWEGWPQQFPEAYHRGGCPCPGLLALWRSYTPEEQHQTLAAPGKRPAAQKS